MGLLLFVLPYICSFFFLSRFLSKISPQPFKIETSGIQVHNDKLYYTPALKRWGVHWFVQDISINMYKRELILRVQNNKDNV